MANFASNRYDVVVCGAGPAGLMAACTLGRLTGGARRILLLDKKEPWKEPIFCAEAVSTDRLNALWPVDPSFVRGSLSGIYFTSPKRYRAEFYSKDCGLILDRARFHHAISDGCSDAGVECRYDALIKKLEKTADGWNVTVSVAGGALETVSAAAVVDASGPSCRLTRGIDCLEGIESGDTDLEPAIFAVAEGIKHSREHIELFFGSEFPDGYGWIFPRDGVEVNIGFVLGKNVQHKEPLRKKLLDFIAKDYPEAKVKAVYGGMISCGQSTRPMAKCGLFKAGDAAGCMNPISRSGIVEALLCGKIVAESVKEWLDDSGANRESIEAKVLERWMAALGSQHLQIARAKPGFNSISDAQFDRAAKKLSKLPSEKQTLFRIFLRCSGRVPPSSGKCVRSFARNIACLEILQKESKKSARSSLRSPIPTTSGNSCSILPVNTRAWILRSRPKSTSSRGAPPRCTLCPSSMEPFSISRWMSRAVRRTRSSAAASARSRSKSTTTCRLAKSSRSIRCSSSRSA